MWAIVMPERFVAARKAILPALLVLILVTRIYPLTRGSLTNIETLDTMLVIKQVTLGNTGIFFNESWLQVYMITIPYAALKPFLSLTETLYAVKAVLVLFSGVIVYLLGKELVGKRSGYLSMLLFAVSPIAIYTQSLGVWTGDVIAPVLLAASTLFLLYAKNSYGTRAAYLWGALSVISLFIAYVSWNGGLYAVATYTFIIVLLVLKRFIGNRLAFLLGSAATILVFLAFVFSGFNTQGLNNIITVGGVDLQNVAQFLANNNYSLYGSGAVTNPVNLVITPPYQYLLYAGFAISTLLIIATTYFFIIRPPQEHPNYNAFLALWVLYLIAIMIALANRRFDSLAIIPIAILAGTGLDLLLKYTEKRPRIFTATAFVFTLLIMYVISGDIFQINNAFPPTDLGVSYLLTMNWISQFTPTNATFLTNVYDEAPIQYFGSRQSAIDGWGGGLWNLAYNASQQKASRMFDNFLFSPSCNSTYLQSTHADYLVIDRFWLYPGYIENKSANGTNMQDIMNNKEIQMSCGNTKLVLSYESVDNNTMVYEIYNAVANLPTSGDASELLLPYQINSLFQSNFSETITPSYSVIDNYTFGNVLIAGEQFVSPGGSAALSVSYERFSNAHDTGVQLSTLLHELPSAATNLTISGELYNTSYVYINGTTTLSQNEKPINIMLAAYRNYLIYFRSSGMHFSFQQAKQLLYNQLVDIDLYCQTQNTSSNSITFNLCYQPN